MNRHPEASRDQISLARFIDVPVGAVMLADVKARQCTIEALKGNTEAARDVFENFLAELDYFYPLAKNQRSRDAADERHPLFDEESNDGEEEETSGQGSEANGR